MMPSMVLSGIVPLLTSMYSVTVRETALSMLMDLAILMLSWQLVHRTAGIQGKDAKMV